MRRRLCCESRPTGDDGGPGSGERFHSQPASRRLSDHQYCGGVGGNVPELMPSHMMLFTVKLPWASSFTVQMVS